MSITNDQYNRILSRLNKIENTLNDILTAMENYVSVGQVNQLLAITQTELAAIAENVDALELRVTAIEEEPLK